MIALEQSEHTIVEPGTNPDCWIIRPRIHPDAPIKIKGEVTTDQVGQPTFANTGYDLSVFGSPEVQDAPVCPACTTGPRNGFRKFRVIGDDGEPCVQLYADPTPRRYIARGVSAVGDEAAGQPGDAGDVRNIGASANASLAAKCTPMLVRPTATICGFLPGCVSVSRTVNISIGQESGSDTVQFDIPAQLAYQFTLTGQVVPCGGGDPVSEFEISCQLAGGSWMGPLIEVPGGHKVEAVLSGAVVLGCDIDGQFTYQPGQLSLELDGLESPLVTDEEEECDC